MFTLDQQALIACKYDRITNQFLGDELNKKNSPDKFPTKFAYIMNNPLSGTDPSGYSSRPMSTGSRIAGGTGSFSYQGTFETSRKTVNLEEDNGATNHQQEQLVFDVGGVDGNGNRLEEFGADIKDSSQIQQMSDCESPGCGLSPRFQSMLDDDSFRRAVNRAEAETSRVMSRSPDSNNRYDQVPPEKQFTVGAIILEKSFLRKIYDSNYLAIPGNEKYALGEISENVADAKMSDAWKFGGLASDMAGHAVDIDGVEAVLINFSVREGGTLLNENLMTTKNNFLMIDTLVPVIVYSEGRHFLIEGKIGPIEVEGL